MTLDEMRALFPSAQTSIHLNHAGVSPVASPVADAVRSVVYALVSDNPFPEYMAHQKRQEALREAFGRMMNVAPQTIGFVRNTSHGLAIIAQALPLAPGENIVVAGNEYPANVYPWMARAEQAGGTVKLVPPRADGIVLENDLLAACDDQTRLLAVSWVQWGTGQRMDLARLGDACRARDIYFAVDLVQGLGALRIDLGALPVDFAASGCHKWLLAPAGLGVVYVRDGLMPALRPTNIGWNSVERPIDWENIHYQELRMNAARFEEGSPALLATAALHASVEILEAVGFDAVADRVLDLAVYARGALEARGLNVISPSEPVSARSSIMAFRHPTLSNEAVMEALQAAGVAGAVRCGNIRFAPHAYNTYADIDAAVAAIPS